MIVKDDAICYIPSLPLVKRKKRSSRLRFPYKGAVLPANGHFLVLEKMYLHYVPT